MVSMIVQVKWREREMGERERSRTKGKEAEGVREAERETSPFDEGSRTILVSWGRLVRTGEMDPRVRREIMEASCFA